MDEPVAGAVPGGLLPELVGVRGDAGLQGNGIPLLESKQDGLRIVMYDIVL